MIDLYIEHVGTERLGDLPTITEQACNRARREPRISGYGAGTLNHHDSWLPFLKIVKS